MSDVSVLGLGAMGTALARVLIEKGHSVTVWNRTAAKAQPLVSLGGIAEQSPTLAIEASPLIIVCVGNYDDANGFIGTDAAQQALAGKTLIQLTTGTPVQARGAEAHAIEAGHAYLDGAIMAYPSEIGLAETNILIGGDEEAYAAATPVLQSLAGDLTYLGGNVGLPAALDHAMLSVGFGAIVGMVQGALFCEAEGFPVSEFAEMIPSLATGFGAQGKHLAQTIANADFDNTEASLATYSHALDSMITSCGENNINDEFPKIVSKQLHRAMDAGHGGREISAMIEILRQ